jgi:molybdate transport system permease protein
MMDLSPLYISLKTAGTATVFTFFAGIGLAYFVVRLKRYQGILDAIITLPMVLPPTVVGFFLLLIFGKHGFIGQLLLLGDIRFVFTWKAAVTAAVIVSLPLMYRTSRGAFEQMDVNLLYAARTLGASEWRIFWRILLPNARQGILAGLVLSFTRALGEFGATIMVAGNLPGITQTMSTAIYAAVQANDDATAFVWVAVVVSFSFLVVILMNYWMARLYGFGRKGNGAGGNRSQHSQTTA